MDDTVARTTTVHTELELPRAVRFLFCHPQNLASSTLIIHLTEHDYNAYTLQALCSLVARKIRVELGLQVKDYALQFYTVCLFYLFHHSTGLNCNLLCPYLAQSSPARARCARKLEYYSPRYSGYRLLLSTVPPLARVY